MRFRTPATPYKPLVPRQDGVIVEIIASEGIGFNDHLLLPAYAAHRTPEGESITYVGAKVRHPIIESSLMPGMKEKFTRYVSDAAAWRETETGLAGTESFDTLAVDVSHISLRSPGKSLHAIVQAANRAKRTYVLVSGQINLHSAFDLFRYAKLSPYSWWRDEDNDFLVRKHLEPYGQWNADFYNVEPRKGFTL